MFSSPKERSRYCKLLCERIQQLGKTEHDEIYKKISDNGIEYTQNKNGVFINLSSVSDEVLKEVNEFVQFCMNNKTELDAYENYIHECKLSTAIKQPVHVNDTSIIVPVNHEESLQNKFLDDVEELFTEVQSDNRFVHMKKKYARRRAQWSTAYTDNSTDATLVEEPYPMN